MKRAKDNKQVAPAEQRVSETSLETKALAARVVGQSTIFKACVRIGEVLRSHESSMQGEVLRCWGMGQ
jgi:hypothetical protein